MSETPTLSERIKTQKPRFVKVGGDLVTMYDISAEGVTEIERLTEACRAMDKALDNFYDGAPDSGNARLSNGIIHAWDRIRALIDVPRARSNARTS